MAKITNHKDSVGYWKSFTDNNADVDNVSFVPKDAVVEFYIEKLRIKDDAEVLDAGSGFGRLIPIIRRYSNNVHALDYDVKMLESLQASYGKEIKSYTNASMESSGYEGCFFDHIICWGVFDELWQEAALAEFSRILKVGGTVLITGKHCLFDKDDNAAFAAEEAARRIGHKNFYTRLKEIDFASYGLVQKSLSKFKRRGDFSENKPCEPNEEKYYEFCVELGKVRDVDNIRERHFPQFGFSFSDTWFQKRLDITRRTDLAPKTGYKNIFISGVYRSGTTILSQIIGAHPDVFMSYDSVKYMRFCIQNQNNRSLNELINETLLRLQSRWKINLTRETLLDAVGQLPETHAELYSKILLEMAKLYKPTASLVGEKNVLCWKQIPNFLSMFTDGKVIHVVRDPRDVAASYKKMTYEKGLAYLDSAFNCLHSHYAMLNYLENFGQDKILLLKLEDLTDNPLRSCYRICDFLDISFSEDMLAPSKYKDRVGNEWKNNSYFFETSKGIFKDHHRWSKMLTQEETLFVESIATPVMNFWGYDKSEYDVGQFPNAISMALNDKLINKSFGEYMANGVGKEGYPSDPIEKEMKTISEV
ncbi:sulfotransferase [Alphaproteobacteria bacterium]|nr:sulfotransferase [Alphaproteobacteria bacterium]